MPGTFAASMHNALIFRSKKITVIMATFLNLRSFLFLCLLCFVAAAASAQDLEHLGDQKPFQIGSGFSLSSGFYRASGVDDRQAPFTWALAGAPVVQVYGIRLPFSFVLSNQHRSFQQPFNQFGVTPTWKWVKLHAGYSSAQFSPYTLAGRRFLGGGVELTPGKFRFGFVGGRFQKAVAYDSTAQLVPGQYLSNVPVPAFSRHGYALRLGVGSRRTFFDMSLLKARDRLSTALLIPDSLGLYPEENAVLGLSTQVTFLKKLIWRAEGAASAYTLDATADTLDLSGVKMRRLLQKLLQPRTSTQVLFAGETSLAYHDKVFGMKIGYKRIEPDFKSMGAYFFQTDMAQWTVAPTVNLFKQKLRLGGSLGLQRNNLAEMKSRTTNRTIGSVNLSLNTGGAFGIDAAFSNYGIRQKPRASLAPVLLPDTLRLVQVAQTISLSPHWFFGGDKQQHTMGCSVNFNRFGEQSNLADAYPADTKNWTANAFYSLNLIDQHLALSGGLLYQTVEAANQHSNSTGFNLGVDRSFREETISAGLTSGFYRNGDDGNTLQLGGHCSFTLSKWCALNAATTWMRNSSSTPGAGFSEFYANAGLSFNF